MGNDPGNLGPRLAQFDLKPIDGRVNIINARGRRKAAVIVDENAAVGFSHADVVNV